MKKLIIIIIAIFTLTLTGCDENKEDLSISQCKYYINDSDYWSISSHNGFVCIDAEKIYDEATNTYEIKFKYKQVVE